MRLVRGGASRVRKTKSSSKKQQRADKKNNRSKNRAHEIFSFEELLGHPTDDHLEFMLYVDDLMVDDQHLDCTDDPEVFSVEELLVHPTDDHLEFMLYVDDQHSDRTDESDDPELLFSENELLVDVAVAEEKAFGDDTDDIQLQLQEEDQEIINSFMACFDDHDQLQ